MSTASVHYLEGPPDATMSGDWGPASDADVARGVARCFERAVAEQSEPTMAALREATIALATAMRTAALRPERAVVLLKEVLRGHGGAGWAPSIAAGHEAVRAHRESLVYGELFAWWVGAYYADRSPAQPAPRQDPPAVNA